MATLLAVVAMLAAACSGAQAQEADGEPVVATGEFSGTSVLSAGTAAPALSQQPETPQFESPPIASPQPDRSTAPALSQQPEAPVFEQAAPVQSQQSMEADFGSGETAPSLLAMGGFDGPPIATLVEADVLRGILNDWRAEYDVDAVRIGIGFPDSSIAILGSGTGDDGGPVKADGEFSITSITKTMTASIILTLVSQGVIDLDATAPAPSAVPDFGHADKVTYRQLLQHSSGIVPYQRPDEWDRTKSLTPSAALDLADNMALEWPPGTDSGYSNSGYLYLGLLAEDFTGGAYADLLEIITEPAGLTGTHLSTDPRAGWIGYSAGGVRSTAPDLVRWGMALYRDGLILSDSALDQMLDVDNQFGVGLGANPVCPCGTRDDGSRWYTSIGHNGGSVSMQYSPADDLVIVAQFSESFWTDELHQRDIYALIAQLRLLGQSITATALTGSSE